MPIDLSPFDTYEKCTNIRQFLESAGYPIPPELSEKIAQFESIATSGTPIWDTLRMHYSHGTMPANLIECVESTARQLLEDGPRAEEPGLLLGKIQCGKTAAFQDVIGLTFDRGIEIAIVFTKGTKALVSQTIKRMRKDFSHFAETDDLSQRVTIDIRDIMEIGRNGVSTHGNDGRKRLVIVCKKETRNLERLQKLFTETSPFLRERRVLIVDDEADFASRNYSSTTTTTDGIRTRDIELAKVSKQLDDFRKVPAYCRYLQVTATPYSLYLQPRGDLNLSDGTVKAFRPRFTTLVPVHDAYVGGNHYYVKSANPDSMFSHLYRSMSPKCLDVLGREDRRYVNKTRSSGNVYDLTYAIVGYLMATAIRCIQERAKNRRYKSSAIIHTEIDKHNHHWQAQLVTHIIGLIRQELADADTMDRRVYGAIDAAYDDMAESSRKGRAEGLLTMAFPRRDEVIAEMKRMVSEDIRDYCVCTVNSDGEMNDLLDEDNGELRLETAANIFVGGNILDRGVTISNLLCFIYGRDPKRSQQDAVLQHARMYGARPMADMAVMRFHTTDSIYKTLKRIHELDEEMREWLALGNEACDTLFVGYDKNIKPCAPSKIKMSNTLLIKENKVFVPTGFWTGSNAEISGTVEKIDNIITHSADYANRDSDGIFAMPKAEAREILRLIKSTFVYDEEHDNEDRSRDIDELIGALEFCCSKSDGMVWVAHRTDRNMSRIRENGSFEDSPNSGNSDLQPARRKATDRPLLFLLRQNGKKEMAGEGDARRNKGWNNAPFYWPSLMTQKNVSKAMFAVDAKPAQTEIEEEEDFLEGYNRDEVLSLTFIGDLVEAFGEEGEMSGHDEMRLITKTTAPRYLEKNADGTWKTNPDVPLDEENYHGIFSRNNDIFPFVFRQYRYLCLRNGRNARADKMLIELKPTEQWRTYVAIVPNASGDLAEEENNVLAFGDTELDRNMEATVVIDPTYCAWVVELATGMTLKYRPNCANEDGE